MVDGRLPSETIGLHLERDGEWLRFYDPATARWLHTPEEREEELEAERDRAAAERDRAEAGREQLAASLQKSEKEVEQLRRELEEWRRRSGDSSAGP